MRLRALEDLSEQSRATAQAAMRAATLGAEEQRQLTRSALDQLRNEAEEGWSGALRTGREERDALRTNLLAELTAARREERSSLGELRQRVAACWEGMRGERKLPGACC